MLLTKFKRFPPLYSLNFRFLHQKCCKW